MDIPKEVEKERQRVVRDCPHDEGFTCMYNMLNGEYTWRCNRCMIFRLEFNPETLGTVNPLPHPDPRRQWKNPPPLVTSKV